MLSGDALQSTIIDVAGSAGLFIALWVILGNNLFKPYLRLLEDREARTSGDEKRALELNEMSEDVRKSIDDELRGTRLQGLAARDAAVTKAKDEARRITDEASEKARKELDASRAQIEKLKSQARAELASEAQTLATTLRSRLLAERGSQTIH